MTIKLDYEELEELVDNLEFLILDHEFDDRYLITQIFRKLKDMKEHLKKSKYNDLIIVDRKIFLN